MRSLIAIPVVLIMLAGAAREIAARDPQLVRAGNAAFTAGRFDEAAALYAKAAEDADQRGVALFNTGVLRAWQGNAADAAVLFAEAAGAGLPPEARAWALYNRGVVLAAIGRLSESANEFKQALLLAPGNDDMRTNLEIVLARDRRQPPKPPDPPQADVPRLLNLLPDQTYAFVHGRPTTRPTTYQDW